MMRFLAVVVVLGVWVVAAGAAPVCKVADPELIGDFVGDCDGDGYATGRGAARGAAEYVGEFRRGKKHGHGVKVWPSGDRYVGGFDSDMKQGYGIYVFGSASPWAGDRYVGQFLMDRRHGQGVYRWSSGDSFAGQWKDDRLDGTVTPMQVLQGLHARELRAVLRSGARVCRDEASGIGGRRRTVGRVEGVEGERVRIRLDDGTVGLDALSDWILCN